MLILLLVYGGGLGGLLFDVYVLYKLTYKMLNKRKQKTKSEFEKEQKQILKGGEKV